MDVSFSGTMSNMSVVLCVTLTAACLVVTAGAAAIPTYNRGVNTASGKHCCCTYLMSSVRISCHVFTGSHNGRNVGHFGSERELMWNILLLFLACKCKLRKCA